MIKNPPLQVLTNKVEFKWIRLGLAAKWDKAVQPALRLATVQVAFFLKSAYRDYHDHNCHSVGLISHLPFFTSYIIIIVIIFVFLRGG